MPDLPVVVSVTVADPPELWRDLGFSVDGDGVCLLGGVEFRLAGLSDRAGITGWSLDRAPESGLIDGVPTAVGTPGGRASEAHPNGVTGIDHLVLRSPDVDRTADALARAGFGERRRRDTDSAGNRVDMRFFLAAIPGAGTEEGSAKTVIELVGPREPDPSDDRPAHFWGLALTSDDIDATAAHLGERGTTPKDAIQPGRRIMALRREAGSSTAIAVMTPHTS